MALLFLRCFIVKIPLEEDVVLREHNKPLNGRCCEAVWSIQLDAFAVGGIIRLNSRNRNRVLRASCQEPHSIVGRNVEREEIKVFCIISIDRVLSRRTFDSDFRYCADSCTVINVGI